MTKTQIIFFPIRCSCYEVMGNHTVGDSFYISIEDLLLKKNVFSSRYTPDPRSTLDKARCW